MQGTHASSGPPAAGAKRGRSGDITFASDPAAASSIHELQSALSTMVTARNEGDSKGMKRAVGYYEAVMKRRAGNALKPLEGTVAEKLKKSIERCRQNIIVQKSKLAAAAALETGEAKRGKRRL